MRHNEELSRQITSHLKENNFENIPSRATILRILAAMPAAKAKELRGSVQMIVEFDIVANKIQ